MFFSAMFLVVKAGFKRGCAYSSGLVLVGSTRLACVPLCVRIFMLFAATIVTIDCPKGGKIGYNFALVLKKEILGACPRVVDLKEFS